MANFPNRCQDLKINGTQCESPALRRNRFCFFHKRFQDEQIKLSTDRARRSVATFVLPVLEDANSIQMALMQVMRLLVSGQLDHKTASLLLYALQTASTNLRMTKFEAWRHDVILDPRDAPNTPLNSHLWSDNDFEEEQTEEESEADRAIALLEKTRKKKEEDAKWMRWAEMQYPDPRKANPAAAVTPTGSAVLNSELKPQVKKAANEPPPASSPRKPPTKEEINQQIREQIRKEFLPGYSAPKAAKPSG